MPAPIDPAILRALKLDASTASATAHGSSGFVNKTLRRHANITTTFFLGK